MKVMVTGVNGFVGKHLARELRARGHQVHGVGRETKAPPQIADALIGYHICDLTVADDVKRLPLDGLKTVINLAGLANVGDSFKNPNIYNRINVQVLSVIGDRLIAEGSSVRIIAVSSGAVYEPVQQLPLTEASAVTKKGSPYAASKLLMESASAKMRERGMDCVVVRPFNHIGPGQERGFLLPDLYAKISDSFKGGQPVMTGNLDTKRDYTDVRDVVKAYADLAEAENLSHSLYNVCSSKSVSGRDILMMLTSAMGVGDEIDAKIDPALVRASDPMDIFGSHERLSSETGWQPLIALEQTIKDFVESKS